MQYGIVLEHWRNHTEDGLLCDASHKSHDTRTLRYDPAQGVVYHRNNFKPGSFSLICRDGVVCYMAGLNSSPTLACTLLKEFRQIALPTIPILCIFRSSNGNQEAVSFLASLYLYPGSIAAPLQMTPLFVPTDPHPFYTVSDRKHFSFLSSLLTQAW